VALLPAVAALRLAPAAAATPPVACAPPTACVSPVLSAPPDAVPPIVLCEEVVLGPVPPPALTVLPLDSLPPTIVVTSHQNGQTVNTKTITISGTATDAGRGDNGISSVYLYGTIPGATATGAGIANWSQTVTLYPGPNNISIYAYDNSDVRNVQTLTLLINFQPVDALPPTIVITSHTNGQIVATSTIQLAGTATDAGRGDNGISSVYVLGTVPNATAAAMAHADDNIFHTLMSGFFKMFPDYCSLYS